MSGQIETLGPQLHLLLLILQPNDDTTIGAFDTSSVFGAAATPDSGSAPFFDAGAETARSATQDRPVGAVSKTLSLQPGEEATVSFAVAWRFPNQRMPLPDSKDSPEYNPE